jgi:hypothetical protein
MLPAVAKEYFRGISFFCSWTLLTFYFKNISRKGIFTSSKEIKKNSDVASNDVFHENAKYQFQIFIHKPGEAELVAAKPIWVSSSSLTNPSVHSASCDLGAMRV